jgi:hypothetical protein
MQENHTDSLSDLTPSTSSEPIGQKPIDESEDRLLVVLFNAWRLPFTVQSDFARSFAGEVAMAASDGLITSHEKQGVYGRVWRITPRGLELLWQEIEKND